MKKSNLLKENENCTPENILLCRGAGFDYCSQDIAGPDGDADCWCEGDSAPWGDCGGATDEKPTIQNISKGPKRRPKKLREENKKMKKSELRKLIREIIKEQISLKPNRGEKLTTGCLDPIAINYCSVCTEPCLGGPPEYPNANVHPEAVNGCCYYTYEGSQNQMAGVGHIQGTDSFGNTVSIPRDKYKV